MKVEEYIKEHKGIQCYCEAIIYQNGEIEDATPSHTYKLINISGKSQDELNEMMPLEAVPVAWLVDYTNCVSIWYEFGMLPENLTEEQENTIDILIKEGIVSPDFVATKNYEMKICSLNKNIYEAKTDEEREKALKEFDDFFSR